MGNNNSSYEENNNKPEKTFRKPIYRQDRPEDTTLIVNKIHEISKDLWNEYTTEFLNPNFCDRVAIAYRDRLAGLTVKQLRGVYNSLNKNNDSEQLDLVLTHKATDTDKFITDQFKSRLTDMFGNKKRVNLSYKLGEIKAIIDGDDNDIFYINSEIKDILNKNINQSGGQHPDDMVYQDMSMPPPQVQSQSGNPQVEYENMSDIETLFSDMENEVEDQNQEESKQESKSNSQPNSQPELEPKPNSQSNSQPEPEPEPEPEPNSQPEQESEQKKETESKNDNSINDILNSIKNINKNNKNNRSNNNKSFKNINDDLNKIKEDVEKTDLSNEETNNKVVENENREKSNQENRSGKTMNKRQLCEAISNHYLIRSNIIAAILTMVPHKDPKTQDYEGSFCFDRLRSLNQGTFCLPPNISHIVKLPVDQQAKEIQKYIGKSKNQCDASKGIYKLLTPKERTVLLSSNDEYNKIYIAYTDQLQERYREYLVKLLEILEILAGDTDVNNKELERISNDTKELIDNMYKMCQFNYLMAMLAFIKLDLSRDNATIERDDRHRESLYSGLE